MTRRRLDELNLLDDFFFSMVSSHEKYGERIHRMILETIYGRRMGELFVIPQKTILGEDTDCHGIRMDVYLEERDARGVEEAMIYDIEPDRTTKREDRLAWPKRSRFYHGKIDGSILKSGAAYRGLKRVHIIVITPYDPFGRDRMIYTIKNVCLEEPGMSYEDDARTIFLYTGGKRGDPPRELRELLCYMEHTREEYAVNDSLKELHQMIKEIRKEAKTMLGTLRMAEREQAWKDEGRMEGRMEGRLEGRMEGRLEGQREERKNTERERRNVELERQRAETAEAEVVYLKSVIEKLQK